MRHQPCQFPSPRPARPTFRLRPNPSTEPSPHSPSSRSILSHKLGQFPRPDGPINKHEALERLISSCSLSRPEVRASLGVLHRFLCASQALPLSSGSLMSDARWIGISRGENLRQQLRGAFSPKQGGGCSCSRITVRVSLDEPGTGTPAGGSKENCESFRGSRRVSDLRCVTERMRLAICVLA